MNPNLAIVATLLPTTKASGGQKIQTIFRLDSTMHLKIQYQRVSTGARLTLSRSLAAYLMFATGQQSVNDCLCPSLSPHLILANAEVYQALIISNGDYPNKFTLQARGKSTLPNVGSATRLPAAEATALTAYQVTAK